MKCPFNHDCENCPLPDCISDDPLTDFYSRPYEPSGRSPASFTGRDGTYYSLHRDEKLLYSKQYYQEHLLAKRAYQREYYRLHKAQVLSYQAQRRVNMKKKDVNENV